MPITVLVIAVIAAGAILLIFLGLAGGSSVDPVQARLTQLGSMQAKNLEELELQQPFIERTLRPLAARLSGTVSRVASTSFTERTEKRLALAGNPGDLRVADWLGIKAIGAIVGGVIFFLLFVVVGVLGFPFFIGLADDPRRRALRLHDPGVLAGRPGAQAPEGHPADDPGHARPARRSPSVPASASTPRSVAWSRSSRAR